MPTEVFVEGMTCRACEIRVQRALRRVPGVEAASADAGTGRVSITTSAEISRSALAAAVATLGEDYRLGTGARRAWLSRERAVWRDLGVAVVVVALLALAAQATGLTSLADGIGTTAGSSMSLAVVALLGIAAGFSTCMALVGGLVLAFSARSSAGVGHLDAERGARWAGAAGGPRGAGGAGGAVAPAWGRDAAGPSVRDRWRPQLAFNAGRIAGFAVLGAATGLAGTAVTLTGPALAIAMLVVAVVMTLLGIQLSGASPRLAAGLVPVLPDALSGRLQRAAGNRDGTPTAAVVGAATYFLPCGFTQAVQLYALSTGSAAQGAAIMTAFAVGTAPGLLAIGGLSASVRGVWATRFARLAAVAVLAFALVNAGGALTILAPGWERAVAGSAGSAAGPTANVQLVDGVQHVTTTQVADGYEPAHAVVVAGVPVVWQVTSEALTCASWLEAPGLGVPPGTVLVPGETSEFRFTPTAPGSYTYACGMGMYTGTIEVTEPSE